MKPEKVTAAAGRDRVVTSAMMAVRLGFVVAVVLGLGQLFGLWSVGIVHVLAGVLVLAGILVAGVRALMSGRGGTLLLVGLVLGIGGAFVALRDLGGLFHLALMVVTVGLAEMSAAKLKKA